MKNIREILLRSQYTGKWGCQRYLGKDVNGDPYHCLARMPDRKDESITYDPSIFHAKPRMHHPECTWRLAWEEMRHMKNTGIVYDPITE